MEEELQKTSSYPGYPAHKEQHEEFEKDLDKLEQQFKLEGATLSLVIQTNQRMVSWLIDHINVKDKDLAAYLRANG